MMSRHKYRDYVVIKFLKPPGGSFNKYECIPSSWIRFSELTEGWGGVMVGYPLEEKILTDIRIIGRESVNIDWPLHCARVVFETDTQAEAMRYVIEKNQSDSSDNEDKLNEPRNDEDLTSKENASEVPKTAAVEKTLQTDDKYKQLKRKHDTDETNNLTNKMTKVIETADELSKILLENDSVEFKRHPPSNMKDKNEHLSHDSETEKMTRTFLNNSKNTSEITPKCSEIIDVDKIDTSNRNVSNELVENANKKSIVDSIVFEESDDSCEYPINTSTVNDTLPLDHVVPKSVAEVTPTSKNPKTKHFENHKNSDQDYSNYLNSWEKIDDSIQKLFSFMDNTYAALKKSISSIEGKIKDKSSVSSNTTSNNGDATEEQISQDHSEISDSRESNVKSDTKWTVRYTKPGPDLIELIPHSGVYVREINLRKCHIKSQSNARTLAKSLLYEIFTDEAILKCSYTGSKPKVPKGKSVLVRPGLDLKARNTLVSYVQDYCIKHNWPRLDAKSIVICLKNKMRNSRK